MTATQILFYLISAFTLVMAFLAVTGRKIFRSAIWLLFALVGVAGLYFLLEVEFIAAVQIVVYVGGIVVLIIFSIFLTEQSGKEMARPLLVRRIAGGLAVLLGFALTSLLIWQNSFVISNDSFNWNMIRIGEQMMGVGENGYALPFEVISMLLLAAMIGCIVIALKPAAKNPEEENDEHLNSPQTNEV
jgi:NADH-quinone oxidoreductase subunit J